MKPRQILDFVVTPDGGELVLYQQGDIFYIQIDSEDLMSSRVHGSEEEMARLALDALGARPAPRVLVGGLGMGFTLRSVLESLGERRRAAVVVAEVFPAVVGWNRTYLGHLAGQPLTDPRVCVAEQDVAEHLAGAEPYDVILLDVDNGPEALTLETNRYLYTKRGLERLHRALAPGGILAVWSASADGRFPVRLRRGGFAVSIHRVHARATRKGGKHVIFLARRD